MKNNADILTQIDNAWAEHVRDDVVLMGIVRGTSIEAHGNAITVGMDALIERLVLVRVRRALDRIAHRVFDPRPTNDTPTVGSLERRIATAASSSLNVQAALREWLDLKGVVGLASELEEFIGLLAEQLWSHEVAQKLGLSHPALPIEVVQPLAKLLSGKYRLIQVRSGWDVRHADDVIGHIRGGHPVYGELGFSDPEEESRAHGAVKALQAGVSGSAMQRLVRELVARGWEQMAVESLGDPGRVIVEGGWPRFGKEVGVRGGARLAAIRGAGTILSLLEISAEGAAPERVARLRRSNEHHGGVRESVIEFELINAFRPGYVMRMARSRDRTLVPLPCLLPPISARKLAAKAYAYQMLLLREMRMRATQFNEHRRVVIERSRRDALARDVGLSRKNREAVEAAWTGGETERFLLIERGDRLSLGRRYWSLDVFLLDAARRSARARSQRALRGKKK